MKFYRYVQDKMLSIFLVGFYIFLLFLLLVAFHTPLSLVLVILGLSFFFSLSVLLINYFRKRKFYYDFLSNIEKLDQSYLVLEMIEKPEFYEGQLLYQALYDINKSMIENVKKEKEQLSDFKDYIEMWIHEVKVPLASLLLTFQNHKNRFDRKVQTQVHRLENEVDQVLYYVRSENAEKDYFIKETDLSKVVKNVGLKNMDDLLDHKISYLVENVNYPVMTDSKWLEFILNQVVNNSIKYRRNIKHSYIKVSAYEKEREVVLVIEDNGMGIPSSDLPQVFEKTFTGKNGRGSSSSTGMGLNICKNMCQKLGHEITIESKEKVYTRVILRFAKNSYFDVLK